MSHRTATCGIDLRLGDNLPCICGSTTFDDVLHSVSHHTTLFMVKQTIDGLLDTINMLTPSQSQVRMASY